MLNVNKKPASASSDDSSEKIEMSIQTMQSAIQKDGYSQKISVEFSPEKKAAPEPKKEELQQAKPTSPFLQSETPLDLAKKAIPENKVLSEKKEPLKAPPSNLPFQNIPKPPQISTKPILRDQRPAQPKIQMPESKKVEPAMPNQNSAVLLYAALGTFVLAIAAGFYYYFSVISVKPAPEQQEQPAITETEEPQQEPTVSVEPVEQTESLSLDQAIDYSAKSGTETISMLVTRSNKEQPDSANALYKTNNPLSIKIFNLMLPELESITGEDGWVFITKEGEENRVGIIIKAKSGDADQFKAAVRSLEAELPTSLGALFLGKDKNITPRTISFADGEGNPQIRYFNLSPSDTSLTIDYAILEKSGELYLMIGSSRETLKKMLLLAEK